MLCGQCIQNFRFGTAARQPTAFHLVDDQPAYQVQVAFQNLPVHRRGVQEHRKPAFMGGLYNVGQEVHLVLQQHSPLAAEGVENAVDVFPRQLPVCAAIEQNTVLPLPVHLNYGMSAPPRNLPDEIGLHAVFPEFFQQNSAVFANQSRVPDFAACPHGGNGLIQAFPAAKEGQAL